METPPTLTTARGGRGALTVYACVLRGHGSASPLPRGGGSRAPGCSVPCPLAEYRDHLVKQRHVVARLEINVEGTVLRSDLVDRTRLALIEAKGRSDRESIRTALGQIIDYERFMAPPPKHRGVLLPAKPSADLRALIAAADVTAIWPTAHGFSDTSGGALT